MINVSTTTDGNTDCYTVCYSETAENTISIFTTAQTDSTSTSTTTTTSSTTITTESTTTTTGPTTTTPESTTTTTETTTTTTAPTATTTALTTTMTVTTTTTTTPTTTTTAPATTTTEPITTTLESTTVTADLTTTTAQPTTTTADCYTVCFSTTTARVPTATTTFTDNCNDSIEILQGDTCISKNILQISAVNTLRNATANANTTADALSLYFNSIASPSALSDSQYVLSPYDIDSYVDRLKNVTLMRNTKASFILAQDISQFANIQRVGATFTRGIGGAGVGIPNGIDTFSSTATVAALLESKSLSDVKSFTKSGIISYCCGSAKRYYFIKRN
ncbi:unnamed protein product [Rotaria socialis]|uniref:Uncharacterized protein n=1 Tax=Rotaria socialis TaxID=392032 RepID=A0A821GUX5_9BILA|nr:unnamed protein product [Rotaria socialis]